MPSWIKWLFSYEEENIEELLNIISRSKLNMPEEDCFSSDSLIVLGIGKDNISRKQSYLENLLSCVIYTKEKKKEWIRVADIDSIENSKAKNSNGNPLSIYEFGRKVYMREGDKKGWSAVGCVRHLRKKSRTLNLQRYEWSNRIHWSNSDGSHHFGVLRYWLSHLNKESFSFPALVENIAIDMSVLERLDEYCIYMVSKREAYDLERLLGRDKVESIDLESQNTLIAFKKAEKEIPKIFINILDLASEKHVVNFNTLLKEKAGLL